MIETGYTRFGGKMKSVVTLFLIGLLGSLCCPINTAANEVLSVFVSILPQKYFVEEIGKERVDVHVLVPPGADPHTYEPKPSQMIKLSKAKLFFAIGIGYETVNLRKIVASNDQLEVIHTDHGIPKRSMEVHHSAHGDHSIVSHENELHPSEDGPSLLNLNAMEAVHADEDHADQDHVGHSEDDDHHHHDHAVQAKKGEMNEEDSHDENGEGLDPHIWLSPRLVKIQAKSILNALMATDPSASVFYEKNYIKFMEKIDTLDQEIRHLLEGKEGFQFMVFHPSWGYFADDYSLDQVPIEVEGKSPKPAQLKQLIQDARKNDIRVIFVQPQFSSKSAKIVAREIRGEVVYADPMAENWMENMRRIAQKFSEAIR